MRAGLGRTGLGTAVAVALLVAATGCRVVGPNYQRPTAPMPSSWQEPPPPGWESAHPQDAAAKGSWWEIYNDTVLNGLEAQAGANFSLQAAEARYEAARALIRYYRGQALPVAGTGPEIAPERESANRPLTTGPIPPTFNDYVLPFEASWEPDLWGQVHREVEAQTATAESLERDVANTLLSLQAEIALDYFQLRDADARSQLLNATVQADTQALQLTVARHSGGVVSAVDVAQAQAQLQTTLAQAQDVEVERAQLVHALAVLTGRPPSGFSLPVAPLSATPPPIPPGVPAEVLQRRPDIAAAERQVAAANASIGVAQAAFYPQITLAASGGVQSTALGNLFSLPSTFWSLSAGAAETVFEGGERHAVLAASRASYDEQVATYRQTVLSAFQEVEDNMAALRVLAAEAETEQRGVEAATNSLNLSIVRYRGGVTTYLEVTTAQSAVLSDQLTALDLAARRMSASVLLIKALGGGWGPAPVVATP